MRKPLNLDSEPLEQTSVGDSAVLGLARAFCGLVSILEVSRCTSPVSGCRGSPPLSRRPAASGHGLATGSAQWVAASVLLSRESPPAWSALWLRSGGSCSHSHDRGESGNSSPGRAVCPRVLVGPAAPGEVRSRQIYFLPLRYQQPLSHRTPQVFKDLN